MVACADGPLRVWLRFKGSVVRVATENVRLATAEEVDSKVIIDAMNEIQDELTGGRRPAGYDDLTEAPDVASGSVPSVTQPVTAEPTAPAGVMGLPAEQIMEQQYPSSWMPLARKSEDDCRKLDGLPRTSAWTL